ncbi:hypothetical protein Cylst_6588 (plasmid) [Cylindrospermum stagnale PCC 7417]|uniref:Uncharacterized protein n=1 Tax=Cylindrospermum stagnale PCC 7417 TaxID=56107 RepID=K9X8C5_9NOST|nr:hypothetical protein [Cylindrospermum stagnale]AFZ28359.1 hypothetical protein Cylst_6588 [Cylindrospermum stagnale PCC 7417]
MIDDLPQFEPVPLRPEEENQEEEIFYPRWRCFCCQDSGLVSRDLVQLIMPKYNPDRDKWVLCQGANCDASKRWENVPIENFDIRFIPSICQKLDLINRENWRNTVKQQINIRQLAKKLKMPGSGNRTENDNREVQQQKQEIEAIYEEEWMKMSNVHLSQEYEQKED